MRKYGLLGYPLGHSFSKSYFSDFFRKEGLTECCYENFPLEHIELIDNILSDKSLRGFNVTIPYKQQIIPYLDSLSDEAQKIGAVNCVKIENGRKTGYNTDCYGFEASLLELIGDSRPDALVLGSGGASKAVRYVLERLGIAYKLVSRTPAAGDYTYKELSEQIMQRHRLIVNTTPLGMYPHTDQAPPIPYEHIGCRHSLFDLVYNPPTTRFMENGSRNGARTMNGALMLRLQAEKSWEIWNSKTF